jgi:hypothetical protein
MSSLDLVLAEISETCRRRNDLLRAEIRLTLQIKAICRRLSDGSLPDGQKLYRALMKNQEHDRVDVAASACLPLLICRASLHKEVLPEERRLKELAQKLPIWEWWDSIHGLGALGLATIIAETGDLSNYTNPAKVWKRMGVAVINGERQRKKKGDEALEQGYSPRRHAVIWVVADSLLKKQNTYKELYVTRKTYQAEKWPDRKKGHWHNEARRYVGKRLLRDLWRAWGHGATANQTPDASSSL